MSNKERVMQLIDDMPDSKLVFVVNMLEFSQAYAGEEIEPDESDLKMIADAEKVNDGNTMTMDEVAKELSITL